MCVPVFLIAIAVAGFATGTEETGEAPELIWYVPGGGGYPYDPAEVELVVEAANEILLSEIGATIRMEVPGPSGDFNTKVPLLLAAGEDMDVVWTSHWSNVWRDNARNGYYEPLDDLLQANAPSLWAGESAFMDGFRIDGDLYAALLRGPNQSTSEMRIRADIAEALELDESSRITSLEEVNAFMTQVAELSDDAYLSAYRVPATGPLMVSAMMPFFGHHELGVLPGLLKVDAASGEIVQVYRSEQYRQVFEMMSAWADAGYVTPDALTVKDDEWGGLWRDGQLPTYFHLSYQPGNPRINRPNLQALRVPIGTPVLAPSNEGSLMAITSTSDHKELSAAFLDQLYSNADIANLVVFGIEDRHYSLDGPNATVDGAAGYNTGLGWALANPRIIHLTPGVAPEAREINAAYLETALNPVYSGFVPNTDDLKTEIANVTSVFSQYAGPIGLGLAGPVDEAIADFNERLDSAGLQTIVTELQSQMDAFLATKQ